MDITITHKPLNQDEIEALAEPLRKIVGPDWYGRYCIVTIFVLTLVYWFFTSMDWELLLLFVVVYSIIYIPSRKCNRNKIKNAHLRICDQSALFPVEHQIHLTGDELSIALPDYEMRVKYKGISRVFMMHVSATGDDMLFFQVPGFPIIRKSDFENPDDFKTFLSLLQAPVKGV